MNAVEWLKPRRRSLSALGLVLPPGPPGLQQPFGSSASPAPPSISPLASTQTFGASSGQTVTAQSVPYGSQLVVYFPVNSDSPSVQLLGSSVNVQATLLSVPISLPIPGSFTGASQQTTTNGLSVFLDGQAHTYIFGWRLPNASTQGSSQPVFGTFTVIVPAWVATSTAFPNIFYPTQGAPQILGPVTFIPGHSYQMTVWPIQGSSNVFPSTVLLDLGFSNVSTFAGLDGSYTATGMYSGTGTLTTSAVTAASVLIVTNRVQVSPVGTPAVPGLQGQAFQIGETVVGLSSGAMGNVSSEYDDPGSAATSVLTFSQVIGSFQPGETIQGRTTGGTAIVAYTYNVVVTSSGGMLAITALTDTTPVTAAQQGAASQSGASQAAANAAAAGAAQMAAAAQASAAAAAAAAAQGRASAVIAAQAQAQAEAQQAAANFAANQASLAAAQKAAAAAATAPPVSAAAGETATVAPPVLATAAPATTSTGTIVAVGAGVLAVGGLAWWALAKH